jgi:hypothetical protein
MQLGDLVMELGNNIISDVWIDLNDSEKLSSARNAFGLFSFRSVWSHGIQKRLKDQDQDQDQDQD